MARWHRILGDVTRSVIGRMLRRVVLPDGRGAESTWWLLATTMAVFVVVTALQFLRGQRGLLDVVVAGLLGLLTASGTLSAHAAMSRGDRQREESESFTRILQALSRSVSPDAIADAIVAELGRVTHADHVAVVRLRPGRDVLEATLVSMLPSSPTSNTLLPARLLDLGQPHPSAHRRGAHARDAAGADAGSGGNGSGSGDGAGTHAAPAPDAGSATATGAHGTLVPSDVSAAGSEIADRIAHRIRLDYGVRNTLAAPLRTGDRIVGAIVLSRRTDEPWPAAAARLLQSAASETAAALSRVYSHHDLEVQARTDELTGLPNRRYFDEYCSLVVGRRRATDHVAVLSIDVDHFKRLNDVYGHPVGDEVLRAIGGAIQASVRDDDVAARYGGEEFVVLLRNPATDVPFEIGERIRIAVRSLDLSAFGVDIVTVSVGVAAAAGSHEPISSVVERADRALYAAKGAGRDCVVESVLERA